jgi:predicted porin
MAGRTGRPASEKVEPMKNKSPLALAAALMLLAGGACAQSSVTLFGVADSAMRYAKTDGAGRLMSVVSGAYSSSRFGFRGTEDLGGGMSASFWLESFLNVDTGLTTPVGFQRRSTVSLTSRDVGELRLGRDYTPTHSSWARYDPFGYVGIGAVQLLILSATGNTPVTAAFGANPNSVQRISNAAQFILPRNPWGVEGALLFAWREGGTPANDQHYGRGARIGYTKDAISVSLARMNTRDNTMLDDFTDTALAGSFDAGVVRVSGGVRRLDYLASSQKNYLLAAVVPMGPHELKASWNRAKFDGAVGATSIANDRSDQYAVGYVYHLSKRSHFYSTYGTIHNPGNARFVIPGAPVGLAGAASRGLEVGLNHEF